MVNAVAHTALVVSDLKRSVAFYTGVLGFRKTAEHDLGRLQIALLSLGDQHVELLQYCGAEALAKRAGRIDHLAFAVTDIDKAVAQLKNTGIALEGDPREGPGGMKIAFCCGPDGERLELV